MKTLRPLPPLEFLRERMAYDPETGIFIALQLPGNGQWINARNVRYAGKKLGCVVTSGYVIIGIGQERFSAHRLAWYMYYGEDPGSLCIDHANMDRADNRIANLRLATSADNGANQPAHSNNTSGAKGVTFAKKTGRWLACIGRNGKRYHLGSFGSLLDASNAYRAAAAELHGQFARS